MEGTTRATLHQIVYRWLRQDLFGRQGLGPAATSLPLAELVRLAPDLTEPVTAEFGGDGVPSTSTALIHVDSFAAVVHRVAAEFAQGRLGNNTHVLLGTRTELTPHAALALDGWTWRTGQPALGDIPVGRRLSRVPVDILDEALAQQAFLLRDAARDRADELIVLLAAVLRRPAMAFSIRLGDCGGDPVALLWGLFDLITVPLPGPLTFSTFETDDGTGRPRFVVVPRWPTQLWSGRHRIHPNTEARTDVFREAAEAMVARYVREDWDTMYPLLRGLQDLRRLQPYDRAAEIRDRFGALEAGVLSAGVPEYEAGWAGPDDGTGRHAADSGGAGVPGYEAGWADPDAWDGPGRHGADSGGSGATAVLPAVEAPAAAAPAPQQTAPLPAAQRLPAAESGRALSEPSTARTAAPLQRRTPGRRIGRISGPAAAAPTTAAPPTQPASPQPARPAAAAPASTAPPPTRHSTGPQSTEPQAARPPTSDRATHQSAATTASPTPASPQPPQSAAPPSARPPAPDRATHSAAAPAQPAPGTGPVLPRRRPGSGRRIGDGPFGPTKPRYVAPDLLTTRPPEQAEPHETRDGAAEPYSPGSTASGAVRPWNQEQGPAPESAAAEHAVAAGPVDAGDRPWDQGQAPTPESATADYAVPTRAVDPGDQAWDQRHGATAEPATAEHALPTRPVDPGDHAGGDDPSQFAYSADLAALVPDDTPAAVDPDEPLHAPPGADAASTRHADPGDLGDRRPDPDTPARLADPAEATHGRTASATPATADPADRVNAPDFAHLADFLAPPGDAHTPTPLTEPEAFPAPEPPPPLPDRPEDPPPSAGTADRERWKRRGVYDEDIDALEFATDQIADGGADRAVAFVEDVVALAVALEMADVRLLPYVAEHFPRRLDDAPTWSHRERQAVREVLLYPARYGDRLVEAGVPPRVVHMMFERLVRVVLTLEKDPARPLRALAHEIMSERRKLAPYPVLDAVLRRSAWEPQYLQELGRRWTELNPPLE